MTECELAERYETVNLWRAGGAAKIELNRPDSLNSWDTGAERRPARARIDGAARRRRASAPCC